MDLTGTGRHFLWSTTPTIVTMLGSGFLLSFCIRRLGSVEYGAVVTIGASTSILMLFSGALRYAVVRLGVIGIDRGPGRHQHAASATSIRAAHALFMTAAVILVLALASAG